MVAPAGTGAVMLVALQLVGVAVIPLNVTVLAPCAAPKPVPAMLTEAPAGPDVGVSPAMMGITAKAKPLLGAAEFTMTGPEVAPVGTVTTMLLGLQLTGIPFTPLKLTEPVIGPKPVPLIVSDVPQAPEAGLMPVMFGMTENREPLLKTPATVTITAPVAATAGTGTTMVVSLQLVGVATAPPKVTVLLPCVAPKFVPVIVTGVPTTPDVGLRLLIIRDGVITVTLFE